jgi:hypothetical protein
MCWAGHKLRVVLGIRAHCRTRRVEEKRTLASVVFELWAVEMGTSSVVGKDWSWKLTRGAVDKFVVVCRFYQRMSILQWEKMVNWPKTKMISSVGVLAKGKWLSLRL